MRRVLAGSAAILFCLASAHAAQAQSSMGGTWDKFTLLHSKDVRTEIELSEEQGKAVDELLEKMYRVFRDYGTQADFKEIRKRTDAIEKEMEKYIKETLKEEQRKRLDQIALQQQGPQAFHDPQLRDELKLTEEQRKIWDSLGTDYRKAKRELFPADGGFPDASERQKKTQELNQTYMGKYVAVLDADQQKIWQEKTGKPFKGAIDSNAGGYLPRP